jgi:hypothetical protein
LRLRARNIYTMSDEAIIDLPKFLTSPALSRKPNTIWKPLKGSQVLFMSCPYFEVLFEGTRGPGKTDALLMDFAQHVNKGFGAAWKGILFRQTYPQLSDIISKTKKWFPQIFPEAKYNASEHFWTWPGGEQLLLRQFQREDDYWNYHGHEYPWIGWEELCNWANSNGYKRMMSCCRSSTPGLPRKYRSTTNPYGPGHNWVKHRFRLPGSRHIPIRDSLDDDGKPEPVRVAIHGSIWENTRLLEADPEYVDRIRASARNEAEKKAWLEGSWDIVAGGMFDDVWDPKVHVVAPFEIPLSWRIDRSFDWGSSAPFSVGWWAESDGSDYRDSKGVLRSSVRGDLFRIAEWYGWNGKPNEGLRMLASDVSRQIIEREVRWGLHGRVQPGPADSAIFGTENGNNIHNDLIANVRLEDNRSLPGARFIPADKRPGSRKAGWELVRKYLQKAVRPEKGLREEPGLFVFSTCIEFQRTMPVLPRDEDDPDDVNTDAEDHIADEVRYRVRGSNARGKTGKTTGNY